MSPDPLAFDRAAQLAAVCRDAVLRRDLFTCRCCGHPSQTDLMISPTVTAAKTPADFEAICRYCYHVENMEVIQQSLSGHLAWLPELSQIEINTNMPFIFAAMPRFGGKVDDKTDALLKVFATREEMAAQKLDEGQKNLNDVLKALDEKPQKSALFLSLFHTGMRIVPRPKWIARRGSLTLDDFPALRRRWSRAIRGRGRFAEMAQAFSIDDWLTRLDKPSV